MNPDFDWDDANVRHIALHGITPLEVEQSTLDEKAVLLELQSVKDEAVCWPLFLPCGEKRFVRSLPIPPPECNSWNT